VNHGYFYKQSWAVNAAFLDGHVRFLHLPLSRELATALLTVDGGEEIDEAVFDQGVAELAYAKCYAFAAFVTLALWPGVRLMWRRRGVPAPASC
jgi:prepilin-type processing-associated H-X9-DG protein